MGVRIVWDKFCVVLDGHLVLGDIHIGFESQLRERGYRIGRMHRQIISSILDAMSSLDADSLIILGDLKDSIGNPTEEERFQLDEFFSLIPGEKIVVLGNHDGGLREFLDERGIRWYKSSGFLFDDYYLMHGNANPKEEAKKAKAILACHWHPVCMLKDKNGRVYSERVWIKARTKVGPQLLMLPAFNPFLGGATLNDINESWIIKDGAEVYTMDGVLLGTWDDLRKRGGCVV